MSNYIRFKPNPVTDYLIDNWKLIRDEYIDQRYKKLGLNLLEVQKESNKLNGITVHEKKPLYEGNITAAALMIRKEVLSVPEAKGLQWRDDEEVRWYDDNMQGMPTLAKWIEQHVNDLACVVFYCAQPGSRINHHYGVDSTYHNMRLHLCLTEDPMCQFDIENERWSWKEGDLFGFDDAMYFHGIKHEGTKPRNILVVDIRKDLLKDHAIEWQERPFVPRLERTPPQIINW